MIGKRAAKVRMSEALNCVAGYAVCIETSLTQPNSSNQAARTRAKPAYGPISIGPWIVTRDEVSDPENLGVTVRVNGEQKAHSSTSQLSIKIRALISYASVAVPLNPGDVISAAGVMNLAPLRDSASPMAGDQLEGRIDRIGGLVNPVWG